MTRCHRKQATKNAIAVYANNSRSRPDLKRKRNLNPNRFAVLLARAARLSVVKPMFHMLSCFDLNPGEEISAFQSDYAAFVDEMKQIDLVESTGPIGIRQSDTPMDTDDEREHRYFVIMSFRDREQVDAAYAHIKQHIGPSDVTHDSVYTKVLNPVFTCWQDLP